MRKSLTALAVAATAFIAPMLASGTAYAAEIQPVAPQLPAVGQTIEVDATAVTDIINRALGGGCTTTYVANVKGTGIGPIYTISGLTVTIYGGTAVTYTVAQEGNALAFITCVV